MSESVTSLLEELRDAKKRRLSWLTVGRCVGLGQEDFADGAVAFRAVVARSTGYSDNVLRRFVARASFVDRMRAAGTALPDDLVAQSFAVLELIERLDRVDPEAGRRWLRRLGERPVSTFELRIELAARAAGRERSRAVANSAPATDLSRQRRYEALDRADRRRTARGLVERLLPELSGPLFTISEPSNVAGLVRCEFVSSGFEHSAQVTDGFEFAYLPSRVPVSEIQDLIARAVMTASFFRRFYVVALLGSDQDRVDKLVNALDWLDASTVGVVVAGVDETGPKDTQVSAVRRWPRGTPKPDRRLSLGHVLETKLGSLAGPGGRAP